MTAARKANATANLLQKLQQILGAEHVITDAERCRYFSTDLSGYPAEIAAAVIQPGSAEEAAQAVRAITSVGYAVVPRGGGMSYTRGYVPDRPDSVLVDMRRMNQIVEINTQDMFVTVEAGVTWQQLYDALKPKGVRTPYYGPLSGKYATVGGTLSQNSLFWGSGIHRTAADSCLGLEVVLADGGILSTGSGAHRYSNPFYRHFGPDLTGIFTADTGALGLKTKATLRLLETLPVAVHASFGFETIDAMLDVQMQLGRKAIASECYGFDTFYNDVMEKLGFRFEPKDPAKAEGRKNNFTMHLTVEALDEAAAQSALKVVRTLCAKEGIEIDSAVPAAFKAEPFGGVRTILLGAEGELWLPVHGFFPLSKTKAVAQATEKFFADNGATIRKHGIKTSYLTALSGHEFVIEPSFYWFDELGPFRLDLIEPEYAAKWKSIPANVAAREAVLDLREALRDLFFRNGACSVQIARFYPYKDGMNNAQTWRLLEEIKRIVDPHGLMNPGALGLG